MTKFIEEKCSTRVGNCQPSTGNGKKMNSSGDGISTPVSTVTGVPTSDDGLSSPGIGSRPLQRDANQPAFAAPPTPRNSVEDTDVDFKSYLSVADRERFIEEKRKTDSIRGILLETINILYREYHVRGLRFFRRRVEDAGTLDELSIASNMLMTLGRFHETATPPASSDDDQRE